MPENPHGSANAQAFGQGAQDFPHATGRSFEAVQDRAVADAELGLAGLALEILDIFLAAVAAVADEGVDQVIGDAEVQAFRVWTGKSGRREPLLAVARVFDLGIRLQWCRCWREAWLGGDATRRTVVGGARFEWARRWLGIGLGAASR